MSVQAARDFLKKADTDLVARITGAADLETGLRLAREAGFDFTPEEFKQAAAEKDGHPWVDQKTDRGGVRRICAGGGERRVLLVMVGLLFNFALGRCGFTPAIGERETHSTKDYIDSLIGGYRHVSANG